MSWRTSARCGENTGVLGRTRGPCSGHQSLSIEHSCNKAQRRDVDDEESSSELERGNEGRVNDLIKSELPRVCMVDLVADVWGFQANV